MGRSRLLVAVFVLLISLLGYLFNTRTEVNPVTGENQRVAMSAEQEVAMGQQAAPEMAAEFGGLYPDAQAQELIDRVGQAVVQNSQARNTPYPFDFHLLADPQTVNAFALPGGQIFITYALVSRLQTEGQLAGVLGHEVGHVVARHSAQQMAKAGLLQGLANAGAVAAGDYQTAQIAQVVAQMANMRYGREDELESDRLGVDFMSDAGYDPNALKAVMAILEQASGGAQQPEFMSTHPSPGNRVQEIQMEIDKRFPNGVPAGLKP
ncbi:MAG: M48 family metalloprotease [Bacteroidetes bacterium]|nr:M48 family metalloprotease [Bacteroidota bacterium]